MFKKAFSMFVAMTLTVLLVGEFGVVSPDQAEAGVLTRSSFSGGLNIRIPRVKDRNVRTQTQVQRATAPQLEYKNTLQKVYARMAKSERKYQQRYYRWEKTKYRIEVKAAKRREKEERIKQREREKAQKQALRAARVKRTGSAGGEGSVMTDPREWFTKKIARVDEGGSLSVGTAPRQSPKAAEKPAEKAAEKPDQKGTELQLAPKKSPGIWVHIKRALFGD